VDVWKRDVLVVHEQALSTDGLVLKIILFVMKFKSLFFCFAFVAALALLYILFVKQTPEERFLQGKVSTAGHQTRTDGPAVEHEPSEQQQKRVYQYVAPSNSSVVGKVFQMDNETTLLVQDFLKEKTFNRKPVTLDAKTPFFDFVVAATAASSNHFGELMSNVNYFPTRFPGTKLFCYDIGLQEPEVDQLKKLPHLIYRKLDFDKYPPHIKNLLNYAWKILIIEELLAEFDGVMWFDTSVKVYGDLTHVLERMVHFKSGILFFLKIGPQSHSIAAAVDPGMVEYFPLTPQGKTGLVTDMLPGGSILVFNTADVQQYVMKWASICALVKDCIEPPSSTIKCPPNIWTIPRDQFAGCHRYDQALFSLLVTNLYNNTREQYSLNATEALADLSFHG